MSTASPSRRSRQGALEQRGHGEVGFGVRGFVDALPDGACGPRVATFDTRANKPVWLVGSSARGIARRFGERGYRLAAEPESFFVQGTPGPLEAGEIERAARWGKAFASGVMSPAA